MVDPKSLIQLCDDAHRLMLMAFRQIEGAVPPPKLVEVHGELAFRTVEKTTEQALVQKLARVISGLGAARVLLANGYTQEIAVLQRTLDEFVQDIVFLSLPAFGEDETQLHDQFLKAFFEEEFDQEGDPLRSRQRREMIPRRKNPGSDSKIEARPVGPKYPRGAS